MKKSKVTILAIKFFVKNLNVSLLYEIIMHLLSYLLTLACLYSIYVLFFR